jgi:glycosyltransferase involved in cell wall biosynthesis
VRILVAHSFYRLAGGEDRYVETQVPLLRRRHDVALLKRSNADLRGGLSTALRMTWSRAEQARVEDAIARYRPDIVHLHNAYPALGPAVHLAAACRGVPLVMTVHNFRLRCPNGYMFTEGAPCRRCERGVYAHAVLHRCFPSRTQAASYAASLWTHRFVLGLEGNVALYVSPSDFVRSRLLEWGIAPERTAVVRNFTDVRADPAEPGTFGAYVGRLSSEKGIDVLLRALARAGDPPFKIAGDGPLRAELEALAGALGLRGTVFTGMLPHGEVVKLVGAARFVAFPSLWDENAPIAAMEAMAMSCALLVTNTGGLPELVSSGEGLACEPDDIEGLAEGLRRLMDDDELVAAAGRRGRERARRELSPEHHLDALEGCYERVVRGDVTARKGA